ncbi:colorectal cancer associated 2 isoform X2 [Hoplias malabaricus]
MQAAESRKSQVLSSPEACPTPLPAAHHADVFPASSAPDPYFHTPQFADTAHASMEDAFDQHYMMSAVPSDGLNGPNAVCGSVAWLDGYIPACADYYSNTLASGSPTRSFSLPSPGDYSSYSPPDSHSSSSSSCYSSPSRLDGSSCFSTESCHYQHYDIQHCYSHWPALQTDTAAASQYYSPSDCFHHSYGEDFYYRRDAPSSELCYLKEHFVQ